MTTATDLVERSRAAGRIAACAELAASHPLLVYEMLHEEKPAPLIAIQRALRYGSIERHEAAALIAILAAPWWKRLGWALMRR